MEALVPLLALAAIALLALRFGADSRPSIVSAEERLAFAGVTWDPPTVTNVPARATPAPAAGGPVFRQFVWTQTLAA